MKTKTKRAPTAKTPVARPAFSIRGLAAPAALCLLTLAAFSNSFSTGLPLDNQTLILNDPRIQSATAENVDLILHHSYWWPNGESGLYRPLTTLSYLFNYAILGNGGNPAAYHGINFFLHAANVLLLWALLLRLLRGRAHAARIALFIAAPWAVHPVLTESVTNVVGRADLLAGFSVLGGLLCYLHAADSSGSRRALWLTALGLVTAIGVFSKESAVVLPGAIILYELLCARRWRAMLAGCAATLLPIAIMLWQRAAVLSAAPPAEYPFLDNPITAAGFWIGRLTALQVLGRYLWLALWPAKLSADYSYAQIPLASGTLIDWLAWLTVAAAMALMALFWKRSRLALFFAVFAFLNLLPASNLLFPIGTMMAERLLYLPLAGLIAAAAIALDGFAGHRFFAVGVAVICVAFGVRTWVRNIDWSSDRTIAAAGVRTSPRSYKFHRLLAATLLTADPAHRDLDRATEEADQAVAILAPVPDARNTAGPWDLAAVCHRVKADSLTGEAARAQYEEAAQLAQRSIAVGEATRAAYDREHGTNTPPAAASADSYRTLAAVYFHLERVAEARDAAVKAQSIDPTNGTAYEEIADADLRQGHGEEAAIDIAWGMIAANSQALRGELLRLYRSGVDSQGCAFVSGPNGPALNPACPMVLRDLCEAALRANRPDLRNNLKCPAN